MCKKDFDVTNVKTCANAQISWSLFCTSVLIIIISGAQPEIVQGKGVFVELGHFDKHFVKNTRKKKHHREKS